MKQSARAQRPAISLQESAARLEELAQRLETDEPLTPLFQAIFAQAKVEHQDGVAAAIDYLACLESLLLGAKQARDFWADRARKLKAAVETFKSEATKARAAYPQLPWTDRWGSRLSLCNNSQPSLKHSLNLADKTVGGVLDQEDATRLAALDTEYVRLVSYMTLNTKAVKDALLAGKVIPDMSLERGQHVRGWTKIIQGSDDNE